MIARASPVSRAHAMTLALLGITFVWGSTFVVVQEAVERAPVFSFLGWRFLVATIALGLVCRRGIVGLGRSGWTRGVLLGIALWAGYALQTWGLTLTTPSKAGFITGMFVVLTPLLQFLILRRPPSAAAGGAAVLAMLGFGLLSLAGGAPGGLLPSLGDLLVLGCAFAFALHIVGLGAWAKDHSPAPLATVQLATSTVLHFASAAAEDVTSAAPYTWLPRGWYVWAAIVFTAVLATALAFAVQTAAQRHLPPTRAAIVMSMEPVFAWLTASLGVGLLVRFGVAGLVPDRLTWVQGVGAALILCAMLWAELAAVDQPDALAAPETGALVSESEP